MWAEKKSWGARKRSKALRKTTQCSQTCLLLFSALQGFLSFLLGLCGHISEKSPPSFPPLPNPLTAQHMLHLLIQTKEHPQNPNPQSPSSNGASIKSHSLHLRSHFRSSLCSSAQGTLGKSTWKAKDAPAVPHVCFGGKST